MEGIAIDMAGVVGVDWRRYTFAELRRMYLARVKHDYRLNSRLVWASYAFGGMGGRKKRMTPDDFNPLSEKQGRSRGGIALNAQSIGALFQSRELKTKPHVPKPVKE